ncbi:glycosyltransferase family 4 protein [uncultured Chitinophaga sp.]|jgi:Glycosyltransferase|uniref:glycosyltransferase family 4 protein n=1 Tax=uncultured Chitinophaga sp. TaxID=339340 RepID=UPI00261E5E8B|nr:glycosyltransferase family 4 protein [uncultured Chitinophaga sp.]
MRVLFASYVTIPEFHQPEAWLNRIKAYRGILETLNMHNEVLTIEQISYEGLYQMNGVEYHFKRFPHRNRITRLFPLRQHRYIQRLQPDVVIVHGLHFAIQTILLRLKLGRKVKIIVQHHAEKPAPGIHRILRWIASHCIDAYMFTAIEMGLEWVKARNIKSTASIREVMEASSTFFPADRALSRARTQVSGEMVYLWVGRLNENKDPLTVVKAFLQFLVHCPGARLYMIYHKSELLEAIETLLAADPAYQQAVIFVGRIPHEELQHWFNSADFIVAASYYEGSGIAVCEGMSCGCIPVLTAIPSFRMMTGNGKCGLLFPPGDVSALLSAFIQTLGMDREEERRKTLEQFHSRLSFEAIARHMEDVIDSI